MSLAPVFLSCAITGGMSVPGQSAAIPVTPDQIIDSAVEANAAGAAIVHIHVREPETGKPVADLGLFRRCWRASATAAAPSCNPLAAAGWA